MRHCDRCNLDYTGELTRCALCGAPLHGEAAPSPFPVAAWHRFRRTVHRALILVALAALAVAAIVCAAFGLPGLLIALAAGIAAFIVAKLLLTQGPLGTKLAKFFSIR
ncbi:hypothetical protein VJ923_06790 [Adlercreutzia sp. R25]|uniref:hypothetical protein n=1 Tax=Adlercreutzia shanghongiae TaxID=3111773 RepID=UPI002DBCA0EB|nr:hypothetical protein [Adlercreutzia sp. R25]MEC4272862.1 hypothetical protein [Adlercreutzia sp. R25]